MFNQRVKTTVGQIEKRHKLPVIILSLFMVVAFSGCGDTSTSNNQTQPPGQTSASATSAAPLASTSAAPISQGATATLSVNSAPSTSTQAQNPSGTPAALASQGLTIDWKPVDAAMGKTGAMQPGGVYKFSLPRTDLQVTLKGITLKAGFALGSHIEMLPMGKDVMAMGDLVLTEDEVEPVMLKLEEGGVNIAALHNHLLSETPRIMYMHFDTVQEPVKLAGTIHAALSLSKTPFTATAAPAPTATVLPTPGSTNNTNNVDGLNVQQLDTLLGYSGKANNGVYQYSIARSEKVMDMGMELPNSMGIGTAINFQPTGDGKAAVTGDFALLDNEVNPVIQALRGNGIEVTALHSHMLSGTPQLFYLHFFANDDQLKLAKGLRAALDQTASAKQT